MCWCAYAAQGKLKCWFDFIFLFCWSFLYFCIFSTFYTWYSHVKYLYFLVYEYTDVWVGDRNIFSLVYTRYSIIKIYKVIVQKCKIISNYFFCFYSILLNKEEKNTLHQHTLNTKTNYDFPASSYNN